LFRFAATVPDVTATIPAAARSDARRNRELLVAAAREAFAASGADAPARDIARRAGLGIGTLYRHFATREELVDAVLADAFEEVVAVAQEGLDAADPWDGFVQFLERTVVLHGCNRGLKDLAETAARGRERVQEVRDRIRTLVAQLVARAQDAGALRADFAPEDVAPLIWGLDRVRDLGGDTAPDAWRRQLAFVLDGLRA
jgi:AcrR family transcriptional regulator